MFSRRQLKVSHHQSPITATHPQYMANQKFPVPNMIPQPTSGAQQTNCKANRGLVR